MSLIIRRTFSVAAKADRRATLAAKMGKIDRVVANSAANASAAAAAASNPKLNESYLRTWLGNDMAGQGYLQQMVAASRNRLSQMTGQPSVEGGVADESAAAANPMMALMQERQARQGVGSQDSSNESRNVSDSANNSHSHSHSHNSSNNSNNNFVSSSLQSSYFEIPTLAIDISSGLQSVQSIPSTNSGEIVVLDLGGRSGNSRLLTEIVKEIQSKGYSILGAQNVPSDLASVVAANGLKVLALRSTTAPAPEPVEDIVSNARLPELDLEKGDSQSAVSKFYQGTVRSGQQVYGQGSGLVVVGGVNDGGEVMADGDIHIYGPLSGRAVAGLGSDESIAFKARIFSRQFRPSLVGISDAFVIPDDHPQLQNLRDRAVMVSLENEARGLVGAGGVASGGAIRIPCEDGNVLVFFPM